MSATAALTRPEGVIEVDGMLWKTKRGATASADEFTAARTLFLRLHQESRWNPWVLDHHQAELEHARGRYERWARKRDKMFKYQDRHGTPAAFLDGQPLAPEVLYDPQTLGELVRR